MGQPLHVHKNVKTWELGLVKTMQTQWVDLDFDSLITQNLSGFATGLVHSRDGMKSAVMTEVRSESLPVEAEGVSVF